VVQQRRVHSRVARYRADRRAVIALRREAVYRRVKDRPPGLVLSRSPTRLCRRPSLAT
jgi:hypothetical protein